jgi:hypothetical protein
VGLSAMSRHYRTRWRSSRTSDSLLSAAANQWESQTKRLAFSWLGVGSSS